VEKEVQICIVKRSQAVRQTSAKPTDNAAMVAAVAHHKISQGIHHDMNLNADPALKY
jgi:tRNA A37 threonylcarbamoyltransferase TsaD